MVDKELFRLIGGNKKYIFIAVLLQAIGLVANVAITGSVCYAVYLLTENAEAMKFVYPLIGAAIGISCEISLFARDGRHQGQARQKREKRLA